MPAVLDITVISTLQSLMLEEAASIAGSALTVGEERKLAAHSDKLQYTMEYGETNIFGAMAWCFNSGLTMDSQSLGPGSMIQTEICLSIPFFSSTCVSRLFNH